MSELCSVQVPLSPPCILGPLLLKRTSHKIFQPSDCFTNQYRRRNRQKRRQRSSLLFEGLTWMPHLRFSSKDDWKNFFWKNIFFCRVVGLNQMIIHFSEASILLHKRPFFFPSFSSNHPGAKSVVRHGIEWIPPPSRKQQRRPLPSLLSVSSSMLWNLLSFNPSEFY